MTSGDNIKVGDPVFYKPKHGKPENGIVKSLCDDPDHVFVVYHANDEWKNFRDYTAARTRILDLHEGWVDKDGRTPLHQDLAELKQFGLMDGIR